MDVETREQLQQLTSAFYSHHAASFDRSRSAPWASWDRIPKASTVLDVGCGNGRFYDYLSPFTGKYVGVDSEPCFIDIARDRYPEAEFRSGSLPDALGELDPFELVVVFGVMHHIAGYEQRADLMTRLRNVSTPEGHVVVSFWQPRMLGNFSAKVLSEPDIVMETNDYLLGWNGDFSHLRYCHHFDDEEIESLIRASGLDPIVQFQGANNDRTNRYVVLRAD